MAGTWRTRSRLLHSDSSRVVDGIPSAVSTQARLILARTVAVPSCRHPSTTAAKACPCSRRPHVAGAARPRSLNGERAPRTPLLFSGRRPRAIVMAARRGETRGFIAGLDAKHN